MSKVAIYTLGCKTNQLESSVIEDDFIKRGWEIADFNDAVDLYIINTCSVTSKTDNEAKYQIRRAKRKNPNAKIILVGCYVQVSPAETAALEGVDLVLGNKEKMHIFDFIENMQEKSFVSDIMLEKEFYDREVHSASGRTRANIKIQDGCNNRCSYCIIPYARGKSRSNKLENIVNQIKDVTQSGFKEVVLTGIHLGQWGLDFKPQLGLLDLLKEIEKIDTLSRYRISSLNPHEFSDELIDFLAKSEKFCRHLHISLQSANNEILREMKRGCAVEQYFELIFNLKAKIKNLAIGSDIIVGFPGETDELFEDTRQNLEKLPIDYIHIFPYSRRKGTPADLMSSQISENIKKNRAKILKVLADKKRSDFKKQFIGKELDVLFELHRDKKTSMLKGLSDNYINVLAQGADENRNQILKVKIHEIIGENAFGKIV